MIVAKVLAAIGLLAIAGGAGIGLGMLEEEFEKMEIRENMENEYRNRPKNTKNGSIFAKICKK